jgi:hypothetical protein
MKAQAGSHEDITSDHFPESFPIAQNEEEESTLYFSSSGPELRPQVLLNPITSPNNDLTVKSLAESPARAFGGEEVSLPPTLSSGVEGRTGDKCFELSPCTMSSSRDAFEVGQNSDHPSISLMRFDEAHFFASRGGGENEFSGPPPPPQLETAVLDSDVSDFNAEDPVYSEVIDFTTLPTGSPISLDSKGKKRVVIVDPRVRRRSNDSHKVHVALFSEQLSRCFAFWKSRMPRQQSLSISYVEIDFPSFSVDHVNESECSGSPPVSNCVSMLRYSIEKHELERQILRQNVLNERLVERLNQLRRETALTRSVHLSSTLP